MGRFQGQQAVKRSPALHGLFASAQAAALLASVTFAMFGELEGLAMSGVLAGCVAFAAGYRWLSDRLSPSRPVRLRTPLTVAALSLAAPFAAASALVLLRLVAVYYRLGCGGLS